MSLLDIVPFRSGRYKQNIVEQTPDKWRILVNFIPVEEGVVQAIDRIEPLYPKINIPQGMHPVSALAVPIDAKLVQLPRGAFGLLVLWDREPRITLHRLAYYSISWPNNLPSFSMLSNTKLVEFDAANPNFNYNPASTSLHATLSWTSYRIAQVDFDFLRAIYGMFDITPTFVTDGVPSQADLARMLSSVDVIFSRAALLLKGCFGVANGAPVEFPLYGEAFSSFEDPTVDGVIFRYQNVVRTRAENHFYQLKYHEADGAPKLLLLNNADFALNEGFLVAGIPYIACGHMLRHFSWREWLSYMQTHGNAVVDTLGNVVSFGSVAAQQRIDQQLQIESGRLPLNTPLPFTDVEIVNPHLLDLIGYRSFFTGAPSEATPRLYTPPVARNNLEIRIDTLIPLPDSRGLQAYVATPSLHRIAYIARSHLTAGAAAGTIGFDAVNAIDVNHYGGGFLLTPDGSVTGIGDRGLSCAPLPYTMFIDNEYLLAAGGITPVGYMAGGDPVGVTPIDPTTTVWGIHELPQGRLAQVQSIANLASPAAGTPYRTLRSSRQFTFLGYTPQGLLNISKGFYGATAGRFLFEFTRTGATLNPTRSETTLIRYSSPDAWWEWAPDFQEANTRWMSGFLKAAETMRWVGAVKWQGRVYLFDQDGYIVLTKQGGLAGYSQFDADIGSVFNMDFDLRKAFVPTPFGVFVFTGNGLYIFDGSSMRPVMEADTVIFSIEWFRLSFMHWASIAGVIESDEFTVPNRNKPLETFTDAILSEKGLQPVGMYVPELDSVMWFIHSNSLNCTIVLAYNYKLQQAYILRSAPGFFWHPFDGVWRGFTEFSYDAAGNQFPKLTAYKFTSRRANNLYNRTPAFATSFAHAGFLHVKDDRVITVRKAAIHGHALSHNGFVNIPFYMIFTGNLDNPYNAEGRNMPVSQQAVPAMDAFNSANYWNGYDLRVTGRWIGFHLYMEPVPVDTVNRVNNYFGGIYRGIFSGVQFDPVLRGFRRAG